MPDDAQTTSFTGFMTDLAVAIVAAVHAGDEATTRELAGHLTELVAEAAQSGARELSEYFAVLRGLLLGQDAAGAAGRLAGPYRAAYERILQELEAGPVDDDANLPLSEWLAQVATIVATTVKQGTAAERSDLEQALIEMAGQVPPEDTEFHDFVAALRTVVRGEDTRALVITLRPPYREAFHRLLQLLAADDTGEFALHAILERIEHNTVVALNHGSGQVRRAVARALADLDSRLPEGEPTTAHFRPLMAGARALLLGQEPPAAVHTLPEPFAATWQAILAAAGQS